MVSLERFWILREVSIIKCQQKDPVCERDAEYIREEKKRIIQNIRFPRRWKGMEYKAKMGGSFYLKDGLPHVLN